MVVSNKDIKKNDFIVGYSMVNSFGEGKVIKVKGLVDYIARIDGDTLYYVQVEDDVGGYSEYIVRESLGEVLKIPDVIRGEFGTEMFGSDEFKVSEYEINKDLERWGLSKDEVVDYLDVDISRKDYNLFKNLIDQSLENKKTDELNVGEIIRLIKYLNKK